MAQPKAAISACSVWLDAIHGMTGVMILCLLAQTNLSLQIPYYGFATHITYWGPSSFIVYAANGVGYFQ